jgi:hypothetical protein
MADTISPPPDHTRRDEIERYYSSLSGAERRLSILLEPAFRDAYNEIIQAHQVVQLPRYFWDKWVPLLGPTTTTVYVNLRKHCYYNSRTGEMRDNWQTRQETLARECGIKDRKTLRKSLVLLESLGFIERKADHLTDPRTGRPYRITDTYQVFFEVPLVDQDAVEMLLRQVSSAASNARNPVMGKVSPLRDDSGSGPVDNSAVKGRFSSSPEENVPSKRDYLELPNERNVAVRGEAWTELDSTASPDPTKFIPVSNMLQARIRHRLPPARKHLGDVLPQITTSRAKRDELLRIEALAGDMLDQLGDSRSRPFYRLVARRFLEAGLERLVRQALSEIKISDNTGSLRNPGAVFTSRVKELAAAHGVDLRSGG